MTLVILTQSINDGTESQFNSYWSEMGVTGQGTHLTFFTPILHFTPMIVSVLTALLWIITVESAKVIA